MNESKNIIDSLNPVEFTWTEGSRKGIREAGFIAQEVKKVDSSLVIEAEDAFNKIPALSGPTGSTGVKEGKILTIDYEKIIPYLVENVKRLNKEVKLLKEKLNES